MAAIGKGTNLYHVQNIHFDLKKILNMETILIKKSKQAKFNCLKIELSKNEIFVTKVGPYR